MGEMTEDLLAEEEHLEAQKHWTKQTSIDQPPPVPNEHPAIWDLVLADIHERDLVGAARYSTRLQPHNGRDALKDAYAEGLDLVVYLRQAIYERDGK